MFTHFICCAIKAEITFKIKEPVNGYNKNLINLTFAYFGALNNEFRQISLEEGKNHNWFNRVKRVLTSPQLHEVEFSRKGITLLKALIYFVLTLVLFILTLVVFK